MLCSASSLCLLPVQVNVPLFLIFLTYLSLSAYLVRIRWPLKLPPWRYALFTLVDVEANFLAVLA
jgi:Solute carrier family 35